MVELTLGGGVGARVDAEIVVSRSRFLCRLVRVETEVGAKAVVQQARTEHWNARHHCSAFVLGPDVVPGQVRRCSDDGEPAGTAGRPMLAALTGRGLIDCVAVVTRYFGGVLLGAGGLARAYSEAVLTTIDKAGGPGALVARERREVFTLALAHADAGRIESELRQRGVTVQGTDYGQQAVLTLTGPAHEITATVAQATGGVGTLRAAGYQWVDTAPGPAPR